MRSARKKNRSYLIVAIAVAAALLVLLLAVLAWLKFGSGMNPDETETPTQSPTERTETTVPTTEFPEDVPTMTPTTAPTAAPTTEPTESPTTEPTVAQPTEPTVAPTAAPTVAPTTEPTQAPTTEPTVAPTTEPTMPPATEPTTEPTEAPEDNVLYGTGTVDTPYLILYYDDAFADHIKIVIEENMPYTVAFYACLEGLEEQHLFTIYMGAGADGNLGVIQTACGQVPVSIVFGEIDADTEWSADERNTIFAMQDAANDLIDQLMMHRVQDEPSDPTLPTEGAEYTEIDTPYCTLSFPEVWQAYLRVEREETAEDYRVLFYGQMEDKYPVLLFTIIFGGDYGEQMGAIITDNGQIIPVNIDMKELSLSGYTDAEMTILYSMQEAANQLISELPLA